jgi:hypothetical protein
VMSENSFDGLASDLVKKILNEYGVEPIDQELERLRAENAAAREIVEAVAAKEPGMFGGWNRDVVLFYNDSDGELECPFCNGSEVRRGCSSTGFHHESDCPVTRARELLGGHNHEQ